MLATIEYALYMRSIAIKPRGKHAGTTEVYPDGGYLDLNQNKREGIGKGHSPQPIEYIPDLVRCHL